MYKIICGLLLLSTAACSQGPSHSNLKKASMSTNQNKYYSTTSNEKLVLPDSVWKQVLSPEVYYIAREKGTERKKTEKTERNESQNSFPPKFSC